MKYDSWTVDELIEEQRQKSLNRMDLDEYLGGKNNERV